MNATPLACTKCGSPVGVAEDVLGCIDWGPAAIGEDGVVRPADPDWKPPTVMSDTGDVAGRPRAYCINPDCGHQWRLRRPFDPVRALTP